MSYQSEVAIALSPEGQRELEIQMECSELLRQAIEKAMQVRKNEGYVLYHFNTIHWTNIDDECYRDIYELSMFLENLDSEYYNFVRLGENIGDFEEEGSLAYEAAIPFSIGVNQSLHIE